MRGAGIWLLAGAIGLLYLLLCHELDSRQERIEQCAIVHCT